MENKENVVINIPVRKRSCGTCTRCCEGYLRGVAYGIPFYPGKPCHFLDINSGCSIYENRPDDPCRVFECGWLSNPNYPEWAKPNLSNVIFAQSKIDSHEYVYAIESGGKMDIRTLSWAVAYMAWNKINFAWQYDGGWNAIGSDEFVKAYYAKF